MKAWFLSVFLFLLIFGCKEAVHPVETIKLQESQLFKDVQLSSIFPDSKTFVDLVPKAAISSLETKYQTAKEKEGFSLEAFVKENFQDRSMKALTFETDSTRSMYEHISYMWDKLTRGPDEVVSHSSRIALPHKYVVPGGRFQEIYYWDSYFTMEGLLADNRNDLATNMVDNFAFLIDSIGFIPNGTRNYYRSRSQPPFFAVMVDALSRKNDQVLPKYLPELVKEYRFWMHTSEDPKALEANEHVVKMGSNTVLNRYWDRGDTPRPEAYKEDLHLASEQQSDALKKELYTNLRSAAASGWDFSSRWYGEKGVFGTTETTAILPVDLNCLLFFMENLIAKAYIANGDEDQGNHFRNQATNRMEAIQNYFWNPATGFYHDYNFKNAAITKELTLAGTFPLYFKLATPEQAAQVKEIIMTSFLKEGGLVTTLEHSGQQWDAPNGWAPLQWIAVNGLLNYGYEEEAVEIMHRWLALNERVYKNTGKMMEKYNVEDLSLLSGGGEYETQDGFGWTNGVALGFKKILQEKKDQQSK